MASGNDSLQLGSVGPRVMRIGLIVGVIGIALSVILSFTTVTPARFFRAYIAAFMLVTGIALGALIFTMIWHATRAGWVAALRRIFEVTASNLMWLWVAVIPIAAGMLLSGTTHLYEWNVPSIVEHDAVLQGKSGFLNPGFWILRAVIIFGIWFLLARFYLRNSVAQDRSGDVAYTHRMQRLAPVGILLFALTITLGAIDWVMSLEAHWFSTIFGVYTFAASSAACFSFLILTVYFLQRSGKLRDQVTPEHYQDLGKLLFAFGVVFWAYIGFSQFMLIWYANIPEETTWFIIRSQAGWWGVSMLLVIGHFFVPFLCIMSRHVKRRRGVIAIAAGWMLAMSFVDFYWMAVPQVPADLLAATDDPNFGYNRFVETLNSGVLPARTAEELGLDPDAGLTYRDVYGFHPHLVDLTCVVGLLGLFAAATAWRMSRHSLVPVHDPRLRESLAFENI